MLNGRDVSERKAFEEQLAHQAFHDSVTHLANRALFNERVRHAVARNLREGAGMAVLFVDLDDFKTVNDSLGHAVGDRVLLEVAQRISTSIRAADTAARFGGDEFAVLLEDVQELSAAVETAERILESVSRPLTLEGNELVIRASLGISVVEAGSASDSEELIRNADAAMYIAKSDGKGGYRVFEPAMHERVVARLAAARRPPAGARARGVRTALPAAGAPRRRRDDRRRGAAALAASGPRDDCAGRLHPVCRGDRADRRDRALGAARGLPPGQGTASRRSPGR